MKIYITILISLYFTIESYLQLTLFSVMWKLILLLKMKKNMRFQFILEVNDEF